MALQGWEPQRETVQEWCSGGISSIPAGKFPVVMNKEVWIWDSSHPTCNVLVRETPEEMGKWFEYWHL